MYSQIKEIQILKILQETEKKKDIDTSHTKIQDQIDTIKKKLFKSGKCSDITIEARDGTKFKVHKSIIAILPIFQKAIDSQDLSLLKGYSSASLKSVLTLIYEGTSILSKDEDIMMEIYDLSNPLMDEVRDSILKQLRNVLNEQNCEKILKFCANHDINQHHDIIKKSASIILKIVKKENFLHWMKMLKKWPGVYEEIQKKFSPILIDIVTEIYEENIELKQRMKKIEDALLSITFNNLNKK